MSRLKLVTAAMLGLSAGAISSEPASAGLGALEGLRAALEDMTVIENVQYVWRGRRYCWYDDGWRGPGWYQCGYHLRRGFGWGGPMGWQGWRGGYGGEYRRDFRRGEGWEFRRGEGREFRRGEGREFRRGEGQGGGEFRRGPGPGGSGPSGGGPGGGPGGGGGPGDVPLVVELGGMSVAG
jgi:hypothetical protein